MSQKRKLTDDEKKMVAKWAREEEQPRYAGKTIDIIVDDEIDDDGKVHYRTLIFSEFSGPTSRGAPTAVKVW